MFFIGTHKLNNFKDGDYFFFILKSPNCVKIGSKLENEKNFKKGLGTIDKKNRTINYVWP